MWLLELLVGGLVKARSWGSGVEALGGFARHGDESHGCLHFIFGCGKGKWALLGYHSACGLRAIVLGVCFCPVAQFSV